MLFLLSLGALELLQLCNVVGFTTSRAIDFSALSNKLANITFWIHTLPDDMVSLLLFQVLHDNDCIKS